MTNMSAKIQKPSHILAARDKRRLWMVRAAIFFASFLTATAIISFEFPSEMRHRFVLGEPSPTTFFAPLEISYVNEPATAQRRQQSASQVAPAFSVQTAEVLAAKDKINQFFQQLKEADLPKSAASGKNPELPAGFEISQDSMKALHDPQSLEKIQKAVGLLQEQMAGEGILDPSQKKQLLDSGVPQILVLNHDNNKEEKTLLVESLMTAGNWEEALEKTIPGEISKNKTLKNAVLEIASATLKADLAPDDNETKARQKKAAASAEPVMETVKKDELIVQRGVLVTLEAKERLNQIQKKLAAHKAVNKISATGLIVFLIYSLTFCYLWLFEKKIFRSRSSLLLIHGVYVINLLAAKIIAVWPGSSFYLMPMALSSVLLTLLLNPRIGLLSAAVMATLAAPMTGFSSEVILMALLSASAGTFASLQLRKRLQFLRLGAAIGLASFFVLMICRMFQENSFVESFQLSALGLANGLLVTMPLCFLMLPILEWIFNLTTDITLLELSDLNHPLLKRMIIEAPGTYHHSLVVSTLAEAACEAIAANALLARVGCYFHDIGKIAHAEFFTENSQHHSKHEKLTPTMSCLIIMNHVKEGLELGKKFKLRRPILQFIPEHQGTGIIYYFYRKALDHAKTGEKIDPTEFRYPGPKPQSRETAVALLSDSVEAASRSLKEPSPESIRQLIRKIINDKFIDGQLDECDLTLRDLHKIQESFARDLMAIFHTRVKYPTAPAEEGRPDLFEEGQFAKFRVEESKRSSH